jgi:hypothetical protein
MKHKIVTIKTQQQDIDFVIKDFNDAMWGTSSLFETGSCS